MIRPLSLLVLYVSDLSVSRDFYAALGLDFVEERHGGGPVHYSSTMPGGTVLELYPRGVKPASRTRLGFVVDDLDGAVDTIRTAGWSVRQTPRVLDHGTVAVVADPDGNSVELLAA